MASNHYPYEYQDLDGDGRTVVVTVKDVPEEWQPILRTRGPLFRSATVVVTLATVCISIYAIVMID
jgi:hypothetical protein